MRFTRVLFILSLLALVLAPIAQPALHRRQPYTASGLHGNALLHKLEIPAGGGAPPYQYHVISGELPPGLSTPTENGWRDDGHADKRRLVLFWVEATDCGADCGFALSRTQEEFTITILAGTEHHPAVAQSPCGFSQRALQRPDHD